eukprot:5383758-Prymnesium_polylepis.1
MLLSSGLSEDGEMIGMFSRAATCAAGIDADVQPAPMRTSTPRPLKVLRVNSSAPASPAVLSHRSSRKAKTNDVRGSRRSATPSLLLLISRSAW